MDDVTLGEVARGVEDLRRTLRDIKAELQNTYARRSEIEALREMMEAEIRRVREEFEPTRQVVTRVQWLVVSTVLLALLALVVSQSVGIQAVSGA